MRSPQGGVEENVRVRGEMPEKEFIHGILSFNQVFTKPQLGTGHCDRDWGLYGIHL